MYMLGCTHVIVAGGVRATMGVFLDLLHLILEGRASQLSLNLAISALLPRQFASGTCFSELQVSYSVPLASAWMLGPKLWPLTLCPPRCPPIPNTCCFFSFKDSWNFIVFPYFHKWIIYILLFSYYFSPLECIFMPKIFYWALHFTCLLQKYVPNLKLIFLLIKPKWSVLKNSTTNV